MHPLLILLAVFSLTSAALAQSTAFTYQGRLNQSGSPATGLYEITFALYDSATNGYVVSTSITVAPIPVTNGLFTATLDFGPTAFTGAPRWLELSLTVFGSDQPVVTLNPRQPITPTPYALFASGLTAIGTNANALPAFRIQPGPESPNIIGGYFQNGISNGVSGAVVAGGGGLLAPNIAGGNFATVSGGLGNQALAISSTVAGGQYNTAGGFFDTVTGGELNTADGMWSTVAGGGRNHANGTASFIGGGYNNRTLTSEAAIAGGVGNVAAGQASAIPGGRSNVTYGAFSFVGGYRAKNIGDGSFVWADYTDEDFESRAGNQFLIRAHSGVGINTNNPAGAALNVAGLVRATSFEGQDGPLVFNSTAGQPLEFKVNGERALRLEPTATNPFYNQAPNVIGGSPFNRVTAGIVGATIGGGGTVDQFGNALTNHIAGDFGTVSGGAQNSVSAPFATVAGGQNNTSSNGGATVGGGVLNTSSGLTATIGGGLQNTASGGWATVGGGLYNISSNAAATIGGGEGNFNRGRWGAIGGGYRNTNWGDYAIIAGGSLNTVSANWTTVSGGEQNAAPGFYATIPGGLLNTASGDFSFAAGRRAKARHPGAFVWADFAPGLFGTGEDFASTSSNQFLLRAIGGVGINTNDPAGATLNVAGSVRATSFEGAGAPLMFNSAAGQPLDFKVGGERILRLEFATESPNIIGGSRVNHASPGVVGAFIGGGGTLNDGVGFAFTNRVTGDYGTVAGGLGNSVSGASFIGGGTLNRCELAGGATIAGGSRNTILSEAHAAAIGGGSENLIRSESINATIGGGEHNTIGNEADAATIGGGGYNTIQTIFSTIAGGYQNSISSPFSTITGGTSNLIHGSASYSTIAGGTANSVSGFDDPGEAATVGGGFSNSAKGNYSTIAGGVGNSAGALGAAIGGGIVNQSTGPGSTVSGGADNRCSGAFATVGGGELNEARDDHHITVAGGYVNFASGEAATIGGGRGNHNSVRFATIGGGELNQAGGPLNLPGDHHITIAGGFRNFALGAASTIGGGSRNESTGYAACISGGESNRAFGDYSFAGGRRAQALHHGTFVWADAHDHDFASGGSNRFSVRATGGVRFYSAIDTNTGAATAGVRLTSGSGSWSSLSDRSAKENFTPTEPREVLDKVAALPIATWNYKSQDKSIRHIGPTAQDFHAAFNVGENDRTITTVDADGVALAAIQGLNQKLEHELKAKDAQIRQLQSDLAEVKQLLLTLTSK